MTGASASGAPRTEPRRIDWHRAAELLAEGYSITAAATTVGCSRSQLSRKRNHDSIFRRWMEDLQLRGNDSPRIAMLRRALHDAIEAEVGNGNVRVILWLADRLKLVSTQDQRSAASEIRDLLSGLSTEELKEFENLRD